MNAPDGEAIDAERAEVAATRTALAAQRERERERWASIKAEQDAVAATREQRVEQARFAGLQKLAPRDCDPCSPVEVDERGVLHGVPICEALLREYANGRAPGAPLHHRHPGEADALRKRRINAAANRAFTLSVLDMARASPAEFAGDEDTVAALVTKLAEASGLDHDPALARNIARIVIAERARGAS